MSLVTKGIHHITSMVNSAQRTLDFYSGVLGLRLVKKTVNFDRPEVYHLYFGDSAGAPGTLLTFFPWANQPHGRIGTGQVGTARLAVPDVSLGFWRERLKAFDIPFQAGSVFGEPVLFFEDPDGLRLDLVGIQTETRGEAFGAIGREQAIIGLAGAVLLSSQPERTADVLRDLLGMEEIARDKGRIRFRSSGEKGSLIDIAIHPEIRGLMGAGTVHHIAWRAKDEAELLRWRERIMEQGFTPTEVKNRNYFEAVYFKEPGEILFEIATDPPGFAVDEATDELGDHLMLPPWLESERDRFEDLLPALEPRTP
ncbi:ring-cleaving dioxygenase [Saccharibacillus sp. O16]|nr:ring-cleaving dioxygenase [Saccharibacillus sp. O16]